MDGACVVTGLLASGTAKAARSAPTPPLTRRTVTPPSPARTAPPPTAPARTRNRRRSVAVADPSPCASLWSAGSPTRGCSARISQCSTSMATTTPAIVGSAHPSDAFGRATAAAAPSVPTRATMTSPAGGRRYSATPAPAASTTMIAAMVTSSTVLSAVPNASMADSLRPSGMRSITSDPTACRGDELRSTAGASR